MCKVMLKLVIGRLGYFLGVPLSSKRDFCKLIIRRVRTERGPHRTIVEILKEPGKVIWGITRRQWSPCVGRPLYSGGKSSDDYLRDDGPKAARL